jgi:hypothetical protein
MELTLSQSWVCLLIPMFRRVFLFFMIMMLTSLALPLPESHAQLRTGDILVTDEFAGTGGALALFSE